MTDGIYRPAKVWAWDKSTGDAFVNISHPTSGPTHGKTLLVDKHPLQLYSLETPNDQKITIMFEELLTLGVTGVECDAWLTRIGDGDQSSSGFVEVSPSSKIPALRGHTHNPPIRVLESGSILPCLTEESGHFLPQNLAKHIEMVSWLFWLQGAVPFLNGGFGHFYHYIPVRIEYAINCSTMETRRLLSMLGKQLAQHKFVAGDEYTVAGIATQLWFGNVVLGGVYDATKLLDAGSYKHTRHWAKEVGERLTVKRGCTVNHTNGPSNEQLHEHHDASNLETSTEDKRQG